MNQSVGLGIDRVNLVIRNIIKYRIIYETLEPDTLVIGSSRTMQISNDIYNEDVLNLSVS